MGLFLTTFFAAFGGAFVGVAATRVVGAWVVRRTFNRMRASIVAGAGAVPEAIAKPVSACCMSAMPDGWIDEPIGYSWVCGVCDQWWEKTRPAMAERKPAPPESDCG